MSRFLTLCALMWLVPLPAGADFWVQMGERDLVMGFPPRPRTVYPERFRMIDPYKSLTERMAEAALDEEPPDGGDGLENYGEGKKKVDSVESLRRRAKKLLEEQRKLLYDWPEFEGRPPEVWDFAEHCTLDPRSGTMPMAPSRAENAHDSGRVPVGSLHDLNELYLLAATYRKYYKGVVKLSGAILREVKVPRANQRVYAIHLLRRGAGGIRTALMLFEVSHKSNKGYNCGREVLRALTGKKFENMHDWLAHFQKTGSTYDVDTTVLDRMKALESAETDEVFVKALASDSPSPILRDFAILSAGRQRRTGLTPRLEGLYRDADDDRKRIILLSLLWMADMRSSEFLRKVVASAPPARRHLARLAYCASAPKDGESLLDLARDCFRKFKVLEGEVFTLRHLRRYELINLMVMSPHVKVRTNLWDRIRTFRIVNRGRMAKNDKGIQMPNGTYLPGTGEGSIRPEINGATSPMLARALASIVLGDEALPADRVVPDLKKMLASEREAGRRVAKGKRTGQRLRRRDLGGIGEPLAIAALARLYELDPKVGLKEAMFFDKGIREGTQSHPSSLTALVTKIIDFSK